MFLCTMIFPRKPHLPFRPEKVPFFYGWLIIFAAIIGILMSLPGQTIGVSVFTDHLIEALKIDREDLSLAYLFGTLLSGLLITRAGRLYDRIGARKMAMGAAIMLGIMLFYITRIEWMVIGFQKLTGSSGHIVITLILMVIGFFGIRFFGQGILTMVSRNMVMKWFEETRGIAQAITGVITTFGFAYAPRLFNDMIDDMGWKNTWLVIAAVSALAFTAFAFIFFRDNPQESGMKPDGFKLPWKKKNGPKIRPDKQYTLKEAVKTYSFWIFNLNIALTALLVTALTFHIVSIFTESGLDRELAVKIFLPASIIAVSINIIGGILSDLIRLKYLLLMNLFGSVLIGMAPLLMGKGAIGYPMLVLGYGLSIGLFTVLGSVVWPRFYGTKHLGAISGFSMSWGVIASAIGPYLFSLSLRYLGTYSFAFGVCAIIGVVLFILAFRANNVNEVRS